MIYSIKKILKEGTPSMLISAVISISAGYVLNSNNNLIMALPGLVIIIPSFINMNGGIASVFSSRLSSALHMGLIKPKMRDTKTLNRNVFVAIAISILSFLVLGAVANIFNFILGFKTISMVKFCFGVLLAGTLSILSLIGLSIALSYYSYSRGIDPDNTVIPILTSVGDFMGILCLFMIFNILI